MKATSHTFLKLVSFALCALLLTYHHTQTIPAEKKSSEKHVVGSWHGGFFAAFFVVLNHLDWCQNNNKIPVVYWDERSRYHNPNGFDGQTNVWEYYFKPVSQLSYKKGDELHNEYSFGWRCFNHLATNQNMRNNAHILIEKYIKIKPSIKKKINSLFKKYIAHKPTIAIHLRGTDKHLEIPPVSPEEIIKVALMHVQPDTHFFIACDDQQLLQKMRELLHPYQVTYYNCYRSNDGIPIHYKCPNPAQSGLDVLIEVLLMARCDILVHNISNVSTAVLYFNPDMEHVVVQ